MTTRIERRMRLRAPAAGLVALVVGFWLGLGGACATADPLVVAQCQETCEQLALCDMLPSPLGLAQSGRTAIEDCVNRCTLSDDAREAISNCVTLTGDEDMDGSDPWCPGGSCERGAICLRKLYGDDFIGNGKVRIRWRKGIGVNYALDDDKAGAARACPDDSSDASDDVTNDDASTLCMGMMVQPGTGTEFKAGTITILLESSRGQIEVGSAPCPEIVGRSFVVEDVPVGVYRVAVQFQAGMGTSTGCGKIYGNPVRVEAGITKVVAIELPSSVDGVLGSAGDVLGIWACEDCTTLIDEDNDELISCQDLDCASAVECLMTPTDGTDTGTETGTDTGTETG